MTLMARRREILLRYWLPFLLYVWTIFLLSSIDASASLEKIPVPDKVIHYFEYLLLPVLAFRFFLFTGPRRFQKYYFLLGVIISMMVGASDEWYQSHVPGRVMDVFDFTADAAGVLTSAVLWRLWRLRRIPR